MVCVFEKLTVLLKLMEESQEWGGGRPSRRPQEYLSHEIMVVWKAWQQWGGRGVNKLEKYPAGKIHDWGRRRCQNDSSLSLNAQKCHFLRWGTEDGGRWRRRLVHFCTCDAEAALGHPGWVVEKAGDVWDWYSEHRSVPERYSLEISPTASTSFSWLWASLLKNVTISAAMQDSQKFKHLFRQLGLWITGGLKPLQSGRERMREKLTHKIHHHHWVPVSTELGQQAVVTGHCGTRDYHQLGSRWRQRAWRSHLENDRRFQKSLESQVSKLQGNRWTIPGVSREKPWVKYSERLVGKINRNQPVKCPGSGS